MLLMRKYFFATTTSLLCFSGFFLRCLAQECPPPFFPLGRKCLSLNPSPLSWYDARIDCQTQGGDLLRVDTQTQAEIIKYYLTIEDSLCLQPIGGYYIGGTDEGHEGDWVWQDNYDPILVDLWAGGSPPPVNYQYNCLLYSCLFNPFDWVPDDCQVQRPYLCQLY